LANFCNQLAAACKRRHVTGIEARAGGCSIMSAKPSLSTAHPYEPEPYPILHAWPEFWWMSEWDKAATMEARARMNGGQGERPRQDRERNG
jgi:hypothetical protein